MKEPNLVKKPPLTNRAMANQKKILIIAVVCVVALLISTSYAVLTSFDQTDDAVITFTTGNLAMTISREASEITLTTLSNKLPEGDDTGLLNATPIPLTFKNTGTITIGENGSVETAYLTIKKYSITYQDGKFKVNSDENKIELTQEDYENSANALIAAVQEEYSWKSNGLCKLFCVAVPDIRG